MEKEIDEMSEKITDYGYNDEYGYYSDWKDGVSPIIKASIRTLLESFGEEIINKLETEIDVVLDSEVVKNANVTRECIDGTFTHTRLKAKEIISSIGK